MGELYKLCAVKLASVPTVCQVRTDHGELQAEVLKDGSLKLGTDILGAGSLTNVPWHVFPVVWCPRVEATEESVQLVVTEEVAVEGQPDILVFGGCLAEEPDVPVDTVLGYASETGMWSRLPPMHRATTARL